MSLLSLPNELLIAILAELEVQDIISVLETHPDLYQISFQCLRNRHLDLRPYCTSGDIFRVRLLLKAGANADYWSYLSGSALSDAIANGHEEIVKLLLEHGARMDDEVHSKFTPLQLAAKKGYFTIVKLMLDYGVDLNITNICGYTTLSTTIRSKGQYSYHKGGPWRRRGLCLHRNRQMPFSYYDTLKLLLESGSDVNIADQCSRYAALHTAVTSYPHLQQDTIGLLIEHRANVNVRNHEGTTPLHLINPIKPGYDPRCTEIAKLLLDHGADVNVQDVNGRTPLHIAASGETQGNTLTVVYLAHEANVNAADNYGTTPLHLAVSKEGPLANIPVIELLLKSGADVNARTTKGNTPLYLAVYYGAANEVMELLFDYGADWNSSNEKSDTPLKMMADRIGDTFTPY